MAHRYSEFRHVHSDTVVENGNRTWLTWIESDTHAPRSGSYTVIHQICSRGGSVIANGSH